MSETPTQRAQVVQSLRALADLLERHESLPLPYDLKTWALAPGTAKDPQAKIESVFAAAELMGTPVKHNRVKGTLTTELVIGPVHYEVYAAIPAEPEPQDVVTVATPSQVLTTAAPFVRVGAEPAAAGSAPRHTPGTATPEICFTCGKPVNDGPCELTERMDQAIAALDTLHADYVLRNGEQFPLDEPTDADTTAAT